MRIHAVLAGLMLGCLAAAPVTARVDTGEIREAAGLPFDLAAVAPEELDELRGGFVLPTGVNVDFSANLRSFVDGQLVMETALNWTQAGLLTQQVANPDAAAGFTVAPIQGGQTAGGITLPNLAELNGLLLTNRDGTPTALVHDAGGIAIGTLTLNRANDMNIRQNVEMTLTVQNFKDVQAANTIDLLGMRLGHDVASGLR